LLNFALKLNHHPTRVAGSDVDALRTYGFNDQQILETVVLVGSARYANFVSFGLGALPDFDSSKVVFPQAEAAVR
jgi:alkylhydroperoxidase family enzyme